MDPKSAAQTIRDTVTMEQILALYGYQTKHGFMVCPFHGDSDASLKVYKGTGGWHCFGCGKGGSVIDFVMEQEGCDFRTAVIAIDKALRLSLDDPHENPYDAEKYRIRQQWFDTLETAVFSYLDALKLKHELDMRMNLARMKELEMIKQTGGEADGKIRAEDYDFMNQFDEIMQFDEYRVERIDELREEVAAWRRKQRRAPSASSPKK